MMNKRLFFIFLILLVLIVAIVITVVTVKNIPSPEDKALESLNSMLEFPGSVVANEETSPMILSVEERNGYELLSFEINDETAVGEFKVYSPDVYTVAKEIDSIYANADEEELLETIIKKIESAPIIEKKMILLFTVVDGQYEPQLTSEFLDAYYGGVYRLREELLQAREER